MALTCEVGAIERLRKIGPRVTTPVTLEQATRLYEMLQIGWHTPRAIATALELDVDVVLDLVAELGTWLGQSIERPRPSQVDTTGETPAKVDVVAYQDAEKLALYGDDVSPGQVGLFPSSTGTTIVLPVGFDKASLKREYGKARELNNAIKNIIKASPNSVTLQRWLMRKYHRIHQRLTYGIIAGVHRVSQLDRLDQLDELARNGNWVNTEFARVLVEAYDLLDVARVDAVDAVGVLVAAQAYTTLVREPAASELARAVTRASLLNEADLARVHRALEHGERLGDDSIVRRELRFFTAKVEANLKTFAPPGVADLNDGQVRRITEQAGINVEGHLHSHEEQARNLIVEAGLEADTDQLFAGGVQAVELGFTSVYCEALAMRADGRFDWAHELNTALAR